MGFVENDPMRSASAGAHGLKARKQLTKKLWSIGERDAQQVDIERDLGIFQYREDLIDGNRVTLVAERDDVLQRSIVALGINNAQLISALHESLDKPSGDGGFATSRRPGDENIQAIGGHGYQGPVRTSPDWNKMPFDAPLDTLQVVGDQPVD
jgi:hypothetical protein